MSDYIFNVAVYSIVFVSYAVMRVRKYLLKRSSEKIKKINICAVIVNVFVVICVVAFAMPHGSDDENQAYAAASETKTTEKNDSTEGTSETTAFLTASSEDESTTADEETESTQAEADTQAETSAQAEADTQAETSAQAEASTQTAAATQAATQAATEATTTQAVTTTQAEATTVEETTTEEATTAKRTYKADGDYTGSATVDEFEYEVRVTITIENDDISNVAIKTYEEFVEDEEYAYKAASALKSRLLAQKSTSGVDAVSGATYTSNAIFKAFENALESALN